MNIIKKIFNRLKSECIWAEMGFYTRFVYYQRKPFLVYKPINVGGQVSEFCDLAVVSFNNSEVVEYQIRALNRFFKFPFRYTVFDNSTKNMVSEEILAICKKYEVGYVKLPRQELLPKGWGSYSHGIACNYLFSLKSATKPFNVLLACTRPLITELSDKLRPKHPLLPTI